MGWTVYDDYIMRQVSILVKILRHILGLREEGDLDTAWQEIGEAYRELLGGQADLLLRMDSRSGAALLGRPEKMALLADLLHEEAELKRAGKDNPSDLDRRALEYALEAFIVAPISEENAVRINKLAKYVPPDTLDTRYQQALKKL